MVQVARTIVVELVDDLDGRPAAETVQFGLSGAHYEIDLSAEHAAQLRAVLAPFVAAARHTDRSPAKARRQPRNPNVASSPNSVLANTGRAGSDGELLTEMRAWARANGFPVGERGRISEEARQAFLATPSEVRAEQAITFAEFATGELRR